MELFANSQSPFHFKDLNSSHDICVGIEESHYSGSFCATNMGEVLVKLFKRKMNFILRIGLLIILVLKSFFSSVYRTKIIRLMFLMMFEFCFILFI